MTATRVRACLPACRHRGFDFRRGDQATSTHAQAIAVAGVRVERRRCRQRVTRHASHVHPRGVWLVQDVDDAAAVTR